MHRHILVSQSSGASQAWRDYSDIYQDRITYTHVNKVNRDKWRQIEIYKCIVYSYDFIFQFVYNVYGSL